MNADDLNDLLERVHDRQTFFAFVNALIVDRSDETAKERANPSSPYGPGVNGWENGTIEAFLAASLSWAQDTEMGVSQGLHDPPSWKEFAVFLYCGKIYE